MKKIISLFSLLILTLSLTMLAGCANTSTSSCKVVEIAKHGNLILDISGADIFNDGYEYVDVLEVTVSDKPCERIALYYQ